jgi:AraC-like DNA-binding protein
VLYYCDVPPREPALPTLWARTGEDLLWTGGGRHEIRRDETYFHDASTRADRPHYVLQLTLSGEGFYEREGVRAVLGKGTAFFDRIPGDFRYGFLPGARAAYEQVFVSFSGAACERLCQSIQAELGRVLAFGPKSPVESMMLAFAHQHEAGLLRDRYLVSGSLYQLLMTLISTLKLRQLATSPLLSRAIAMVDERSHDPSLDVQTVAARLSCSREHLTRQFRETTGVSAGEYIAQHRLGRGAVLLRTTSDKLEAIARHSGFASASYFCRAFKKRYGITPGELRQTPWLAAP